MTKNTTVITCPNCHQEISIDDVLTHQIEAELNKDFKEKEKNIRESLEKEAQIKLLKKEESLKKQVREELEKEAESEKKYLQEQLAEKDLKLKELRENE